MRQATLTDTCVFALLVHLMIAYTGVLQVRMSIAQALCSVAMRLYWSLWMEGQASL